MAAIIPQKRYFVTNKLVNEFPTDFVNSKNPRHVIVINCTIFIDEPEIADDIEAFCTPKYVTLHADFIHECRHLDSFVMYCNRNTTYPKKFEQFAQQRVFKVYFKDVDQQTIQMEWDEKEKAYLTPDNRKIRFVLEMLLSY